MERKQSVQPPVAVAPVEIRSAASRALRCAGLVLAACAVFACGRTDVDPGPTTDGEGPGGSSAATAAPSPVASGGSQGGAPGRGGSGGVPNTGAAGSSGGVAGTGGRTTDVNIHGCPELYPGPNVTCFRCDPLPAGSMEGCARPNGCGTNFDETSPLRYPEGCYVVFPWKNDWYPDYSQAAYCDPRSGWVCLL